MERVEYEWPADCSLASSRETNLYRILYSIDRRAMVRFLFVVSSISEMKAFRLRYLCCRSDLEPIVQLSFEPFQPCLYSVLTVYGSHTGEQYSRVGRTRALYPFSFSWSRVGNVLSSDKF